MSIESKILDRYGRTDLTSDDIGKVIMCVWFNYKVKGVLREINEPFERGTHIRVISSDNESHLVLTRKMNSPTIVCVNRMIEKFIVRIFTNLPQELAKYVAEYL